MSSKSCTSTFLLLLLSSLFCNVMAKGGTIIINDVKKVVFIGDSITYAGQYISFVESYLKIKNPTLQTQFINVGLPSETVSGLSEPDHANGAFPRPDLRERLTRILDLLEPDLIFTNYGINDGIYLPFDEQRFSLYQQGMQWFHEKVSARGIGIVHIAPPVFDAKHDEAYAQVLHTYADWLLSQRHSAKWQVIDGHWPMQIYLDEHRRKDPDYFLAKDGIHPNQVGHGIIAKQILLFLGYSVDASDRPGVEMIEALPQGKEILTLVNKRQSFLRDAWLTKTGHNRPGIAPGMSLEKATRKSSVIAQKIEKLLH